MGIGLLDLVVAAWVGWWARRGARRGLPLELPRTFGVFVFGVTGFGLFHWTNQLLVESSRLLGHGARGVSWVVLLIGTKLLVNRLRQRISEFAAQQWGHARPWAAAVGGVRAFMLACILLAFCAETGWQLVSQSCLLGRVLTWCLVPAQRPDR